MACFVQRETIYTISKWDIAANQSIIPIHMVAATSNPSNMPLIRKDGQRVGESAYT